MLALAVSMVAALAWLGVLLLPWQPHRTRERLEPAAQDGREPADLGDVTVLIPARDESAHIATTLMALARQGAGLRVLVIDDESTDGTAEICARLRTSLAQAAIEAPSSPVFPLSIEVLRGAPLPTGWGGKPWALHQGLARVATGFTLLLDADIELAPAMIPALLGKARETRAELVSVMARLNTGCTSEKLLAPPFVFFFKLLYPFARVNARDTGTAAAAGGCILVATRALEEIGGFAAIRDALIDDVSLAKRVKAARHGLWLGLSHGVVSRRAYASFAAFWRMVSRSAFTQLDYSAALLLAVAAIMAVMFVAPIAAPIWNPTPGVLASSVLAIAAMAGAYLPVVRFYGLPWAWTLTLPLAALLFLAMTFGSAISYWFGVRARWKNRAYAVLHK
jgi:hopene-associated glycosyltransferase HpnB